jgi:hypothetical protein
VVNIPTVWNEYNNPSFATMFQRALLNTCITTCFGLNPSHHQVLSSPNIKIPTVCSAATEFESWTIYHPRLGRCAAFTFLPMLFPYTSSLFEPFKHRKGPLMMQHEQNSFNVIVSSQKHEKLHRNKSFNNKHSPPRSISPHIVIHFRHLVFQFGDANRKTNISNAYNDISII